MRNQALYEDEKGKFKGKEQGQRKEEGKNKCKKKKKGARARSASSDGSETSSLGDKNRAAAMVLRVGGDVRKLSLCLPATLGSSSGQLDGYRVCSPQNVEPQDVLVGRFGSNLPYCLLIAFVQFQGA